jgi:hypothetical protein
MRVSQSMVIVAAIVVLACPVTLGAQAGDTYTARLGWVPTTPADRPNVIGKGSATATLSGRKLSISGSFDGLAAPATIARLRRGIAKAARGPAISDLTITQAASGSLSGAVDLTSEQLEDLKQGKLYIQVHSAKGVAPDGSTLWGWLLK